MMDALAQQQVNELQGARADESERAENRRTQRVNCLVALQRDRQRMLGDAMRERVSHRVRCPSASTMEQQLFSTLRRTAWWWDDMCKHTVEQQLKRETAERNRIARDAQYLHGTHMQEQQEQTTAVSADKQRWEAAKDAFLRRERDTQHSAVAGAIASLLQGTMDCAAFLAENALEERRDGVIAYMALTDVIRQSFGQSIVPDGEADSGDNVAGRPPAAARAAFDVLFKHQSPFLMASSQFSYLLRVLLRKIKLESLIPADSDDHSWVSHSLPKLLFDVSSVPVLVIDGAKFAGKSLLTDSLSKEFGFVCFSDLDLVSKALAASHTSVEAAGQDVAAANEETWEVLGRVVEEQLLNGRTVPPHLMAKLLARQLRDVQQDSTVHGVVFDGVLFSAKAFEAAQETILPASMDPFSELASRWCGHAGKLPSKERAEGGDSLHPSAEASAEELLAALQPPELPPVEDQAPKKESRARNTKRVVDVATLPPPDLPAVDDVAAEVSRERAFVERAAQELADGCSGLVSAFMHVDCAAEEVFRRFAGLRVDKDTREEYHMTYRPPPPDRVPHLASIDRTKVNTAKLADLVFRQQQEWEHMRRWLHSRPSYAAKVVELDGNSGPEALVESAAEATREALENFAAGQRLQEAMQAAQRRVCELQSRQRRQWAAREAERKRLAALYTEKGVSVLPTELLDSRETRGYGEHANACSGEGSDEDPVTVLCERIPSGVAAAILSALTSFTAAYESAYGWGWNSLESAVLTLLGYRASSLALVRQYWETNPDDKQTLLDAFVQQFNSTPAALRNQTQAKEELHGLIDCLSVSFSNSVSQRKAACEALLESATRRDAFMDTWDSDVSSVGVLLAEAEVTRLTTVANALLFHFSAMIGETAPLLEDHEGIDWPPPLGSGGGDGSGMGDPTGGTGNGGSAYGALTGARAGSSVSNTSSASGLRRQPQNAKRAAPHTANANGGAKGSTSSAFLGTTDDGPGNGESASRAALAEALHRAEAALHSVFERVRTYGKSANGDGKAGKKSTLTTSMNCLPASLGPPLSPGKTNALLARCLPILEEELTHALRRTRFIGEYIQQLMQEADGYRQQIRSELQAEATAVLMAQARAVNTAVFVLRDRVEEERLAPQMHLGCGTFAILSETDTTPKAVVELPNASGVPGQRQRGSFMTDVPLYQELSARSVRVHATLLAARVLQLIESFTSVAPSYQLSQVDFLRCVREADYAGATIRAGDLKTPVEVFDAFDTHKAGMIDWREFVIHLLLWCAPPSAPPAPPAHASSAANTSTTASAASPASEAPSGTYSIPEVTADQLCEMKVEAGSSVVSEAVFRGLPFFFDCCVPEDRFEVLVEALWRTFRVGDSADVQSMLFLMCADTQPVRGAQKVFAALSLTETGSLDREEMETVFHLHATNPRSLGQYDPFSRLNQRLLFDEVGTARLTFEQACQCLMGRKMLNSLSALRRKRFVSEGTE